MQNDLFTGMWVFDREQSQLSIPLPLRWIQQIEITGTRIQVREEITRPDGSAMLVKIDAASDGEFYPVTGSPAADEISYVVNGACISGVARKNGVDSIREHMEFSDFGKMTMTFSILMNSKIVAPGIARFTKR